jgi:FtsP/CotA-like multicopper oxidase with cupredoxin domain
MKRRLRSLHWEDTASGINRRSFLARLGMGMAGLSLAGTGMVIGQPSAKPETGQPLLEPPEMRVRRPVPGEVEASIVASGVLARIGGANVIALGYNGSVPGPTLRVRTGERLKLEFTNRLPNRDARNSSDTDMEHQTAANVTNLHLHGPGISPALDDPFTLLEPGQSRRIELELTEASAGTHWYHPHPHGQVAPQQFKGLAGAMIVTGALDSELQDWEEHVLVLQDFAFDDGRIANHRGFERQLGKPGGVMTVNAQHQPVLRAKKAGLRLRLINASTGRVFRLTLENPALEPHPLNLIALDGHTLEKPETVGEFLLAPGMRADVLVQFERVGTWHLYALPHGNATLSINTKTLLMSLQVKTQTRVPRLPHTLTSIERLEPARAVTTRQFSFEYSKSLPEMRINGRLFDPNRVDASAKLGTLEIWELRNRHGWDLPFHLHSYPFQVLEVNGDAPTFRGWRDTLNLDNSDTVRLLIPFERYAGKTVFHCHISEHEDAGMMGIVAVLP